MRTLEQVMRSFDLGELGEEELESIKVMLVEFRELRRDVLLCKRCYGYEKPDGSRGCNSCWRAKACAVADGRTFDY